MKLQSRQRKFSHLPEGKKARVKSLGQRRPLAGKKGGEKSGGKTIYKPK